MCSSTVAGVSSHEFQSFSTTFLYRAESRTTLTELRASPGPVPADEGRRRREKQHSNFLNRATMVSSRWRTRVMTSWLSILFFAGFGLCLLASGWSRQENGHRWRLLLLGSETVPLWFTISYQSESGVFFFLLSDFAPWFDR
uniref:(northern house mosquito) hypothetical protein n=1 Tax=Culex pipiens TaxID=7175 RepID=A0A8D8ALS4_CULPI